MAHDICDRHSEGVERYVRARSFGEIDHPRKPDDQRKNTQLTTNASVASLEWRKVIGAFQLSIPVSQKSKLLLAEERQLSVLRWIGEAIPAKNRWYPVFQRYLEVIGGRVQSFGGHPTQILPSTLGNGVPGLPGYPDHPGHPGSVEHEHPSFTGKIDGIIYDHFGHFEAFILESHEGGHHRFESHEARVHAIAQRAWMSRIVTTVIVRKDHPELPIEIILRGIPPMEE
jgi:hypothetical protein